MSFDFQRNKSSLGIGDIFVNSGQLGKTAFVDSLGSNLSQIANDFLGEIRYRYYIEPNVATRTYTLGQIGVDVNIGYSLYVKNTSGTEDLDVNEASTNTLLTTIAPGNIYKLMAKQAGSPDEWVVVNLTQIFPENFVYVDPVFGFPPSQARVNRLDLPFLTLRDANVAATSLGATTFFVRPGNYTHSNTILNKANASWYFPVGVNITNNNVSGLFPGDVNIYGSANIISISGSLFSSNSTGNIFLQNLENTTVNKTSGIFVANQLTNLLFTITPPADVIVKANKTDQCRFIVNDGIAVIDINDVFIDNASNSFITINFGTVNLSVNIDTMDLGTNGNGFEVNSSIVDVKINKLTCGNSSGHVFDTNSAELTLFINYASIGTGLISCDNFRAILNTLIIANSGLNVFSSGGLEISTLEFNELTSLNDNTIINPVGPVNIKGNKATIGGGTFINQNSSQAVTSVSLNDLIIGNALFLNTTGGDFNIDIKSITTSSSINNFINSTAGLAFYGNLNFNKADVFVTNRFLNLIGDSAITCNFNNYVDLNPNSGTVFYTSGGNLVIKGKSITTQTDVSGAIFEVINAPVFKANVSFINTPSPIFRAPPGVFTCDYYLFTEEAVSTNSNAIIIYLESVRRFNFGGRFLSGGTNTPILTLNSLFANMSSVRIRLIRASFIAQGGIPTEYLLFNSITTLRVEHQGNTCAQVVAGGTGTINNVGTLITDVNFT